MTEITLNESLALVFPGQGSQSVGMLADILAEFPEVNPLLTEASDVLGYDLKQLIEQGPAEQLDQTMYTQPALLVASVAVWRILKTHVSLAPAVLAGHSLGEYTALVCAEALAFEDAVQLVAARGRFMQDAVAPGVGAMAAIVGLDEATVAKLCKEATQNSNEVLSPANFNSLGQVVVAGHRAAVTHLIELAKQQGSKMAMMLPVSVPSHCALMRPAAERLAELLNTMTIHAPKISVINNVDVLPYETPAAIRDGLVRQLYQPVRWVEIIQAFASGRFSEKPITRVIECGPGKVLAGLIKRIDKQMVTSTTNDLASLNALFNLAGGGSVSCLAKDH